MIKGVQKKIIEVRTGDSLYFERAVFYVKPGITTLPPELAKLEADALLQEASPKAKKTFPWVGWILSGLVGCLVTVAVLLFALGR